MHGTEHTRQQHTQHNTHNALNTHTCILYTSDAAHKKNSIDIRQRRNLKKKKKIKNKKNKENKNKNKLPYNIIESNTISTTYVTLTS